MQGFYPNWMAETSLIRQNVDSVDAMMSERSVLVDVKAAAEDGGWGGGTGTTTTEYVYVGGSGTSDTNPAINKYKERPWPVVIIKRMLTKDENDIDVKLLTIIELKV